MKKENRVVRAVKNDYDKSVIKKIVGGRPGHGVISDSRPAHVKKLERSP